MEVFFLRSLFASISTSISLFRLTITLLLSLPECLCFLWVARGYFDLRHCVSRRGLREFTLYLILVNSILCYIGSLWDAIVIILLLNTWNRFSYWLRAFLGDGGKRGDDRLRGWVKWSGCLIRRLSRRVLRRTLFGVWLHRCLLFK